LRIKKLATKKHILTTKHYNNKVTGSSKKYFKMYSGSSDSVHIQVSG